MEKLKYYEDSRQNAISKRNLELELLKDRKYLMVSNADIYLPGVPGSIESNQTVMKWVHENLTKNVSYKDTFIEVSSHDAFITLHILNSLRKIGIPNFQYYHGVIEKDGKFYAITTSMIKSEKPIHKNFYQFMEESSTREVIIAFISILLAIYNANKHFEYSHYSLRIDKILMKPISDFNFDVEYNFEGQKYYTSHKDSIPLITDQTTTFARVLVDGHKRSFGYNDVTKIPYEVKGIYVDRSYPILDTYNLLKDLLLVTEGKFPELFKEFSTIKSFYVGTSPETGNFADILEEILDHYSSYVSKELKNPILRCSGNQLYIAEKSKIELYLIPTTLSQLYDYVKYHYFNSSNSVIKKGIDYYIKNHESNSLTYEVEEYERIMKIVTNHHDIFEIPEKRDVINNPRYVELIHEYVDKCISYNNHWEKMMINIKIIKFVQGDLPNFDFLLSEYLKAFEENENYYQIMKDSLGHIYEFLNERNSVKFEVLLRKILLIWKK